MNIRKIVKLSFLVISFLVIVITAVNIVLLYQIEDNVLAKKSISELVSLQENMDSLSKDIVMTEELNALNYVQTKFIADEKEFEIVKELLGTTKDNILDTIIADINKDTLVTSNLEILYKNEKKIEVAFDKAYSLQKEKIELLKKFKQEYPKENKLREALGRSITSTGDISLVHNFGRIEYYSKETLYQKRDKETLAKWLAQINFIDNKNYYMKGIESYKVIVKKIAGYIIRVGDIESVEKVLTQEISQIIVLNKKIYKEINTDMENISAKFIDFIYKFVFILSFSTIVFIVFIAYKVSKNVGLSVDEIESKVADGLEEIKALNSEIVSTQHEVIFTMGAIGEQRSKETGNHVKRVAQYSQLLALHYGLSEEEAEMLMQVSPMHDIGKVAIPDAVLNKPGRFNEEERKIMDTHADLGHDMLIGSSRPLLKLAAIVAYEHHEKWDGSGYPRGLSGEDIHICGRITALADVFDALGSDRVYKQAWSDERIFNFFKEERGKHFDPTLIDIFFEYLDEFLKVRDSLKDKTV